MFRKLVVFLVLFLFVMACSFGSNDLKQVRNPTLDALPAREYPTITPGPGPSGQLVCAVYFQRAASPDFIVGSWTNEASATESLQGCYEWVDISVSRKSNCAQPEAIKILVVLIDESRHTYDLPRDINMNTEFVVSQECPP